jgi:AcrR family transcriptional regulator
MPRRTVAASKRVAASKSAVAASGSRRSATLRDERRAQLVAAARDVFGHKGYHAATVDDITRAAGVAKGTFYLYFDEKREVYYELVRSFLQHVKDIGASVAREVHTPQDFVARCEQAAHELVRVFVEHHKLARLAYRESMSLDPELERLLRDFYRDLARVEADNIRLGIELGMFRPVDPLICAYAHIGMVERVALALMNEPSPPEPAHVVRGRPGGDCRECAGSRAASDEPDGDSGRAALGARRVAGRAAGTAAAPSHRAYAARAPGHFTEAHAGGAARRARPIDGPGA